MATIYERAAAHHRRRLPQANGQRITLSRSGGATITVDGACRFPVVHQLTGDDGLQIAVTGVDWWLPADQVTFGTGDENEPRMGDEITDAKGTRYQPLRLNKDSKAVESICDGQFWLVHTKLWEA